VGDSAVIIHLEEYRKMVEKLRDLNGLKALPEDQAFFELMTQNEKGNVLELDAAKTYYAGLKKAE
jgi:hypothetical protein